MLTWLWIGIVAIAIVGIFLIVRQRHARTLAGNSHPEALAPLHRTVFTLQLGDIVQYQGTDWFVEGKLIFSEDGFTWVEYMLQDEDTIRWLSVEEDDQVEVCWMEPVSTLEISSEPPKNLTYEGVTYRLSSTGTARMTRTGTTMNQQAQRCRYFDYEAAENQVLAIEDWNGEMEVSVGQRIRPRALTILPGDGRRVYDD